MWIQLSAVVFLIMAVQDLLHRYFMQVGFTAIEIVMYGLLPTVLFGLFYIWYKQVPVKPPTPAHLSLFLVSGVLSFFAFLWMRHAQLLSPNIGYVTVIIYSSVLLTLILTALFFGDRIHWQGILGAVFIVIGLGLVTSLQGEKQTIKDRVA